MVELFVVPERILQLLRHQLQDVHPVLLILVFPADKYVTVFSIILFTHTHRRRIKTEEKANVVASVWGGGRGEEFIQFLAALAVLPRKILNIRMNFTRLI